MNEELSENVALGDNAEEKNREVYRQPALKKLEVINTGGGGGARLDYTSYGSPTS